MLTLSLPPAPSLNNAFINLKRGGRAKSAKYRKWIKQADACYMLQKLQHQRPILVPYTCKMLFPPKLKGDIDGRGKCILDWMVSRGLTIDDGHCRSFHVEYDDHHEHGELVWIIVRPA